MYKGAPGRGKVQVSLTCTAQPDTHEAHFLYNYRDTALLGAVTIPLFSPLTTGDPVSRLRTTAVAGRKIGLGTDGIANFDSPRGGNGPRTRRRGDGGGRRGIGPMEAAQFKIFWKRGTKFGSTEKRDLPKVQVKGKKDGRRERKKSRTVYGWHSNLMMTKQEYSYNRHRGYTTISIHP